MKLFKALLLMTCAAALPSAGIAQAPELNHVFDICASISGAIDGEARDGVVERTIPITGGEIKGMISGTILPGGADFQLVDDAHRRTRLRAVYEVMTADSVIIKVVNEGINTYGPDGYYFVTSPRFECDRNSPYGWLNDRIFVCRPVDFGDGVITLRVWEAK